MRVFLEGDQAISRRDHLWRDGAVEVQFAADNLVRPDHGADAREHVALAVEITFRHHCTMHVDQGDIDRHGGFEIAQHLIPQAFIDSSYTDARRLGEGRNALHHLPATRFGLLTPNVQRL